MADQEKVVKLPMEAPNAEVVKVADVHTAKSYNSGKGRDTTGTGNSGGAGNQGNGHNNGGGQGNGHGNGNGRR